MMSDLKLCPFCASADAEILTSSIGLFWGKCPGCGAEGPVKNFRFAATEAWNTRAALASEAASQVPADGWQDIASAPKDGTVVLLQEGPEFLGAFSWESGIGWIECHRGAMMVGGCNPTHWHQLPAAADQEGPADGK